MLGALEKQLADQPGQPPASVVAPRTDTCCPSTVRSASSKLDLHVRHIRERRTEQDLLHEILLKDGFPPTTPG